MTLHLVYEKAHTASTRIRLVEMAPHLEARGIPCRVIAYPRDARARRALRDSLAAGDGGLVHRPPPPPAPPRGSLLARPARGAHLRLRRRRDVGPAPRPARRVDGPPPLGRV